MQRPQDQANILMTSTGGYGANRLTMSGSGLKDIGASGGARI